MPYSDTVVISVRIGFVQFSSVLPTLVAHGMNSLETGFKILKSSSHRSAEYLLAGCTSDCLDCCCLEAARGRSKPCCGLHSRSSETAF